MADRILSSVMFPPIGDLVPFAAEGLLALGIVAVLLLATLFGRRRGMISFTAFATIVGALAVLLCRSAAEPAGPRFEGLLLHDAVAVYFKAVLLLFTAGIVILWHSSPEPDTPHRDGAEFLTLLLGATLGMALMGSTRNLLMIWVAVELASLPSYALAGFRRSRRASEASLKYVLFGAACSAIMVYGLSLLYGLCGSLAFEDITRHLADASVVSPVAVVALLAVFVGIAFKIAAVPLHFWCPDVFEGASIQVTAFLSVASKAAGVLLLVRLLAVISDYYQFQSGPLVLWASVMIGSVGAVTATVGNLAALPQQNVKRLLAWSSIAHAGYMLCAMSLLFHHGLRETTEPDPSAGTAAVLVYLMIYLFMNLGAFAVAAIVQNGTGSESIGGFNALGRRARWMAIAMSLCLLSLIGLPPLAGFAAKLVLMKVLFENGSWWIALVVVIGVNTIISLAYYARILRAMWLTPAGDESPLRTPTGAAGIALISAAALVGLFVWFEPILQLATKAAAGLYMAGAK